MKPYNANNAPQTKNNKTPKKANKAKTIKNTTKTQNSHLLIVIRNSWSQVRSLHLSQDSRISSSLDAPTVGRKSISLTVDES